MTKDKTLCKVQIAFDCAKYETCEECPGNEYNGPTTWPCKENLQILLELSDREKITAFDEIVNWFVVAKDVREIEGWIASVLGFYIKKNLPKDENVNRQPNL